MTINIRKTKYKVNIIDKPNDYIWFGNTNAFKKEINLNKYLIEKHNIQHPKDREEWKSVYIHELIHSIAYEYNLELNDNEVIIEILANEIYENYR